MLTGTLSLSAVSSTAANWMAVVSVPHILVSCQLTDPSRWGRSVHKPHRNGQAVTSHTRSRPTARCSVVSGVQHTIRSHSKRNLPVCTCTCRRLLASARYRHQHTADHAKRLLKLPIVAANTPLENAWQLTGRCRCWH